MAVALAAQLDTAPSQAAPVAGPSVDLSHGPLEVSGNGRFLQHGDGTPFFYLGDTAWELFHRLDREEAERYLEDRRRKGFTVVQAAALAERDGLREGNAYGHTPLVDDDPTRPNVKAGASNDYWDHVDHVVERARAKGMYVGMLPTWGDKVELLWGRGPVVFDASNAYAYGRWIGNRYKSDPVIWLLGGDRGPTDSKNGIWRAMARGIDDATGGTQLVTYHPQAPRSSSSAFHADALFDFNALQTGHCKAVDDAAAMVAEDYDRKPNKPVLDAEPRYEDHPICFDPANGRWGAFDVRQSAYAQVFSGTLGHVYGHHGVWQMHAPGRHPATDARTYWYDAIHHPGSGQMAHVRKLVQSRPFFSRVPDQSMITAGQSPGKATIRATRGRSGSYAMVYSGTGNGFSVDTAKLSGGRTRASWYDPRTGLVSGTTEFAKPKGPKAFDPPGTPGPGNDWVLVLDDVAAGYGAPGK